MRSRRALGGAALTLLVSLSVAACGSDEERDPPAPAAPAPQAAAPVARDGVAPKRAAGRAARPGPAARRTRAVPPGLRARSRRRGSSTARRADLTRRAQHSPQIAAARRFLRGFARFMRGRLDARRLEAVSPALRAALATDPPPRAPRPDGPIRMRAVRQHSASGVAAIMDDGRRRYAVQMTLARAGGGWHVKTLRLP